MKEFDEGVDNLKSISVEFNLLKKGVETIQTRLDSITSEYQKQFNESQQTRLTEFNKEVAELKKIHQNNVDEFTKQQTLVFKEYIDEISEFNNNLRTEGKELIADLDTQLFDYSVRAQEEIDVLEGLQKEGPEILGQMSIDGHASAYKIEADQARKMKHLWHWLTGITFAALIYSALWNATHVSSDANLTTIASKWVATLAISAAVTFFARQAGKQEVIERDNRYMQLQLATIDPYLGIFDESERKDVKKQLVDRIFTGVRNVQEGEEKAASITTDDIVKIIEAAAKMNAK